MQTPLNPGGVGDAPYYIYKMGVINGDYGLATAMGFFNSAVSCVLLVIVNTVSKKLSGSSLYDRRKRKMARTKKSAHQRIHGGPDLFLGGARWLTLALLVICVYPLYFVVITSFSKPGLVGASKVIFSIKGFTTMGYENFPGQHDHPGFSQLGILPTVAGTLINLIVTLPPPIPLSERIWWAGGRL